MVQCEEKSPFRLGRVIFGGTLATPYPFLKLVAVLKKPHPILSKKILVNFFLHFRDGFAKLAKIKPCKKFPIYGNILILLFIVRVSLLL